MLPAPQFPLQPFHEQKLTKRGQHNQKGGTTNKVCVVRAWALEIVGAELVARIESGGDQIVTPGLQQGPVAVIDELHAVVVLSNGCQNHEEISSFLHRHLLNENERTNGSRFHLFLLIGPDVSDGVRSKMVRRPGKVVPDCDE
jgi:hypothetical protein